MSQHLAQERAHLAGLRRSIQETASDPPPAGVKLMMSAEDVAAIMPEGRTAETVRDKHREWTKKNGFPAPIPGMQPLVWSGLQVMDWLRGGQTPGLLDQIPGTEALRRNTLQQRYGGAA